MTAAGGSEGSEGSGGAARAVASLPLRRQMQRIRAAGPLLRHPPCRPGRSLSSFLCPAGRASLPSSTLPAVPLLSAQPAGPPLHLPPSRQRPLIPPPPYFPGSSSLRPASLTAGAPPSSALQAGPPLPPSPLPSRPGRSSLLRPAGRAAPPSPPSSALPAGPLHLPPPRQVTQLAGPLLSSPPCRPARSSLLRPAGRAAPLFFAMPVGLLCPPV